ncbi:hypothetical protein NKW84_18240, partial [Acetobacter senegalensis]|uniref:hypothetical protein n=1 Tax=Acetobacter senegalensis TaxID=446692 RepID=UPI00209D498B
SESPSCTGQGRARTTRSGPRALSLKVLTPTFSTKGAGCGLPLFVSVLFPFAYFFYRTLQGG